MEDVATELNEETKKLENLNQDKREERSEGIEAPIYSN